MHRIHTEDDLLETSWRHHADEDSVLVEQIRSIGRAEARVIPAGGRQAFEGNR
jgi:hypothetical protein